MTLPANFGPPCKTCGTIIVNRKQGQRYCSHACRATTRALVIRAPPILTCMMCHEQFDNPRRGLTGCPIRFCSDQCRKERAREQQRRFQLSRPKYNYPPDYHRRQYRRRHPEQIFTPTCPVCQNSFEARQPQAKYCCGTCSEEAARAVRRERMEDICSRYRERYHGDAAFRSLQLEYGRAKGRRRSAAIMAATALAREAGIPVEAGTGARLLKAFQQLGFLKGEDHD